MKIWKTNLVIVIMECLKAVILADSIIDTLKHITGLAQTWATTLKVAFNVWQAMSHLAWQTNLFEVGRPSG